jgi:regulator of replication initiation timing
MAEPTKEPNRRTHSKRSFNWLRGSVLSIRSVSNFLFVLLLMLSLAVNVASLTLSSVFSGLSAVVEMIVGPRTVRAQQASRLDALTKGNDTLTKQAESLTGENRRLTRQLADNVAENNALKKQAVSLTDENRRLTRELADSRITYRGEKRLAREAVKDTSGRLARRITHASSRNVASVFAESLPFVGVGVIVGATAWELKDACELMKDLHELDVAFNPESAVDGTEVCGTRVPDRAEVWQAIRESPVATWNRAKDYMPDLPDFSESYASGLDWVMGAACQVLLCEERKAMPE